MRSNFDVKMIADAIETDIDKTKYSYNEWPKVEPKNEIQEDD